MALKKENMQAMIESIKRNLNAKLVILIVSDDKIPCDSVLKGDECQGDHESAFHVEGVDKDNLVSILETVKDGIK